MKEEDEIASDIKSSGRRSGRHPSIAMPMAIWIALLLVGLVFRAITTLGTTTPGTALAYTLLDDISSFILMLPGIIILPIIFGAYVGATVGTRSRHISDAASIGLVNGIYASVIYIITIVVIYLVMFYSLPGAQPSLGFMLEFWAIAPVVLTILLSIGLSVLVSLRR
ncbi:MAG: hypothetical protein KGH61_03495 [Candidatus Micrarchaeota archaeon]|nr:hypothetical protein [Candidatus Micrarchaeota archaeon]MDE1847987.1 hypothetical protein [Candidatus Micrarchaeota archaeon]MDE1864670.1 hypothetical protein [Candidatus Micrarchaeota archaeon]